jgi:adenylate cyclase
MAADLAGFSRMMSEDEAGTLAALQRCRSELLDPAIASASSPRNL